MIFFGVFEKFETFFSKICAHSERYRDLLAGIVEILTFYGNIAFPLSPVSQLAFFFFSKDVWIFLAKMYPVPSSSMQIPKIATPFSAALRPNKCMRCLLAALASTREDCSVL